MAIINKKNELVVRVPIETESEKKKPASIYTLIKFRKRTLIL